MLTITEATVKSITPFERENTHVKLQYPERFVAITLVGEDGQHYVTMTRKHTGFAESVEVGGCYTITGKVKRTQDYGQLGGQIVLTNCVRGIPANVVAEQKRHAKAKARLAKLMW